MATRTAKQTAVALGYPKATVAEGQNVVLHEVGPDSRGEMFRATLNRFKGKLYLRLGKWYRSDEGWAPGKGVSTIFDDEGVRNFEEAIAKARAALDTTAA